MASLPVRSFTALVESFAAAVQGRAEALVDFSVGSVLRAVAEATADLVLWLESLIVYVLTLTRAATSTGEDLDSWVADFGLTRLGATRASGLVVFARFTSTTASLIPVGATVETADGGQRFTVVADPSNPTYDATRGGYVVAVGIAELAVPVRADIPSKGGNVVAGAISVITSDAGMDTVSNPGAFANGSDAESDAALRARIRDFFRSLSKGTNPAFRFAIASLQLGLRFRIIENENLDGSEHLGFVAVVVDDGTGLPPDDLIAAVRAALGDVRASGIRVGVFAPVIRDVAIEMHVAAAFGYVLEDVEAAVSKAVETYVDTLGLGEPLLYSKVVQVAWNASPGVANVTNLFVAGGAEDIVVSANETIKTVLIIG